VDQERMGMRVAAMLVTLIVAAAVAQSPAQDRVVRPRTGPPGSWPLLGQTAANFTADHDVIVVLGPFDNLRRNKFKVTATDIRRGRQQHPAGPTSGAHGVHVRRRRHRQGRESLPVCRRQANRRRRIEQTEPFAFGEESLYVGHEAGSPVTREYAQKGGSEFPGQVNWVEFDAGIAADDQNHLITPEERLSVAMAKQ
jgi:hypothetical protein